MEGPLVESSNSVFAGNLNSLIYRKVLHDGEGNCNTWWRVEKDLFPTDQSKIDAVMAKMNVDKLVELVKEAVSMPPEIGYVTVVGDSITMPPKVTMDWINATITDYYKTRWTYQVIKNLLS